MNLRWMLGNFTDPQYCIPRREQFRLSNIAHRRFVSYRAYCWRAVLIVLPLLVALKLLRPALGWLGYAGQTGPFIVALLMIVLLF